MYLDAEGETEIGSLINSMELGPHKKKRLKEILDIALTDTLYSVLLGLDGEASIGDRQETYKLLDEDGNELTGGDIESYAWEYFHGEKE